MRSAPDPAPSTAVLDRAAVRAEMEQARLDFRRLVADATPADLRRPSAGTRWTNQQLLFHMLFGYLIVRALLVLVHVFGLLPDGASKAFARLLDSARWPFDLINYLGSRAGARIIPPSRMTAVLDHVIAALRKHLQRETGAALRRGMHYPTTWDPFFAGYMTLADIYRYPTQHFRFHQRQLTLSPARGQPGARPPPRGSVNLTAIERDAMSADSDGRGGAGRAGARPGAHDLLGAGHGPGVLPLVMLRRLAASIPGLP
jgi:DinB superfamily